MSTTFSSDTSFSNTIHEPTPAERLMQSTAAVRLSFTWLGVRKSLNTSQKSQAASSFGAEGKYLSAGKKLLDTSHPAFKAVTAIRGRAISYWKGVSLPFPEPGIRLLRQDAVESFDDRMAEFRGELDEAVEELNRHYSELRYAAQDRLGDLFDVTDYPPTLLGMFAIEHDFPSVEPPSYLRQLSPDLYAQECQRMQHRFDDAVQLAEQAFIDEITKLVDHLSDRLQGTSDGKPRVFRDSAVTNLSEFFDRFRSLNVRSNEQLDQLVQSAQSIVQGVKPDALKSNSGLRQTVASQMAVVQSGLDQLLVDRPRRNIQRRPK